MSKVIFKLFRKFEILTKIWYNNQGKKRKEEVMNKRHKIIESVHPSPLSASRGFFGSKPFSKINNYLKELGKEEINW